MQFSLKAIMIAVAVVAISLVLPSTLLRMLEMIVWFLVPCVLVALILYGSPRQRTFATGSLTAYLAISLQRSELMRMMVSLRVVLLTGVLFMAGWLTVWLEQRLPGRAKPPLPPAPPTAD